jgi:hypothetical protein
MPKNAIVWGDRGVPNYFLLLIGILIFMLLRSPYKDLKPYDDHFWDFNNRGAKRKEKRNRNNLPKIPKFAPLFVRTSLGPILFFVAVTSCKFMLSKQWHFCLIFLVLCIPQ